MKSRRSNGNTSRCGRRSRCLAPARTRSGHGSALSPRGASGFAALAPPTPPAAASKRGPEPERVNIRLQQAAIANLLSKLLSTGGLHHHDVRPGSIRLCGARQQLDRRGTEAAALALGVDSLDVAVAFAVGPVTGVVGPLRWVVWHRGEPLSALGSRWTGGVPRSGSGILLAGVQFAMTLWGYVVAANSQALFPTSPS